jgi:hypothetical protein
MTVVFTAELVPTCSVRQCLKSSEACNAHPAAMTLVERTTTQLEMPFICTGLGWMASLTVATVGCGEALVVPLYGSEMVSGGTGPGLGKAFVAALVVALNGREMSGRAGAAPGKEYVISLDGGDSFPRLSRDLTTKKYVIPGAQGTEAVVTFPSVCSLV